MAEQKLKEEKKEEYDEERKRRELEKKRKEKEEIVSKTETKPTIQEITELEAKVKVPILQLGEPKIDVKEVKISKEIPYVKKEKLEIKVPIIKLSSPTFGEKEIKLNKEVLSVKSIEKKALKIPLVKLREVHVKCIISEFNSTISTIRPRPQIRVRVPIYRILRTPIVREITSLDEKLDEKLLEKLKEEEIRTPKPQVPVTLKEAEQLGGRREIEEEPPEILKCIFGVSKNSIFSGNAKLVWVPIEEFLGSVRYICWRIYREIKGGKAEPKIISNAGKESFKREIENWMKAEGKVFSVEFEESEKLDKEFWESVADRIEELFGQDIGFIITNKKFLFIPKHHVVDIVEIKLPENLVNEKKLQAELCSLIWGFISPDLLLFKTKENFSKQCKFDHIFEIGRKFFERKIKSIGEPYLSVTRRHRGLKESDDMHYPLKVFVVKYIADMLGLKGIKDVDKMKQLIHTEEIFNKSKFGMDEATYPDIYVDASAKYFADEVFEIETLFGEGEYSMKKIDETIEKYEKISNPPTKVNIVLENLTFLIHLKDIIEKEKIHKKLKARGERIFELEFWTLDIRNDKLVSLGEVIRRVKSLYTKLSENVSP